MFPAGGCRHEPRLWLGLCFCAALLIHACLAFWLPERPRRPEREPRLSLALEAPAPLRAGEAPGTSAPAPASAEASSQDSAAQKPPQARKSLRQAREKASRQKSAPSAKGQGAEAGRGARTGGAAAQAAPGSGSRAPTPLPGFANVPPTYPPLAQKRGQQGVVRVRCLVDAAGQVREASVASSSGHRLLDQAALASARGWRFLPALSAGRPTAGSIIVPVEFRLR